MTERDTSLPTHRDYQDALDAQSACNLSGLAHALARVMPRIMNEAHELGKGTDYANEHPIVCLYLQQMRFLNDPTEYNDALKLCTERAKMTDLQELVALVKKENHG